MKNFISTFFLLILADYDHGWKIFSENLFIIWGINSFMIKVKKVICAHFANIVIDKM